MIKWLKSKISLKYAFGLVSESVSKSVETALVATLASNGIVVPESVASTVVEALMNEISKNI